MTHGAGRALLALAACGSLAQAGDAAAETEVFRIDPARTRAEFAVDHFFVATLHGHFGRTHGTIALDTEGRAGSIDFTIDADSIDTGWSVRDDFIRSELMFDAARFPEVRFHSTRLAFDHGGLVGAAGELTMHNVTRPVEVRVERMDCRPEPRAGGELCGVAVVSSVRRSEFGMTFALPFVGDDIDLSFQLTAQRVGRGPAMSEAHPDAPGR